MIATLSAAGVSALFAKPRPVPVAYAVWALSAGRWRRIGVTRDRTAADALATASGTFAVVLPVGGEWANIGFFRVPKRESDA